MLKNAYFLEKTVKNRLSVEGSVLEPSFTSDPCVVTLAYYYSFVKLHF